MFLYLCLYIFHLFYIRDIGGAQGLGLCNYSTLQGVTFAPHKM